VCVCVYVCMCVRVRLVFERPTLPCLTLTSEVERACDIDIGDDEVRLGLVWFGLVCLALGGRSGEISNYIDLL